MYIYWIYSLRNEPYELDRMWYSDKSGFSFRNEHHNRNEYSFGEENNEKYAKHTHFE